MGGKVVMIFFLVVILGGLIYVWNSGLIGKAEQQYNSLLHPIFDRPVPFQYDGTIIRRWFVRNDKHCDSNRWQTLQPGPNSFIPGTTMTINLSQVPVSFTVNQLSPYYHEVRFDGVRRRVRTILIAVRMAADRAFDQPIDWPNS